MHSLSTLFHLHTCRHQKKTTCPKLLFEQTHNHPAGKAAGSDKKLYKQIEIKYDPSHSPPDDDDGFRYIISPFGPLDQPASRRTLFYLIGTLNASFPDYDFS